MLIPFSKCLANWNNLRASLLLKQRLSEPPQQIVWFGTGRIVVVATSIRCRFCCRRRVLFCKIQVRPRSWQSCSHGGPAYNTIYDTWAQLANACCLQSISCFITSDSNKQLHICYCIQYSCQAFIHSHIYIFYSFIEVGKYFYQASPSVNSAKTIRVYLTEPY